MTRYINKSYWQWGPLELQYGHVSHSLVLFYRRPWRRLLVLHMP